MPDILYIKTSDGVILRFADRNAFRTWVQSGRIPLADEVLWLDAAENWRPLQELLDILGITLSDSTVDARASRAFPGIQDDFFKKSFGPSAAPGSESPAGDWGTVRRPVITGRYGAVQDVVDVGQPKRRTTAPMAAFDVSAAGGDNQVSVDPSEKIDVTGEFGRPVTEEMIAEAEASVDSPPAAADDVSVLPDAVRDDVSGQESVPVDSSSAEDVVTESVPESVSNQVGMANPDVAVAVASGAASDSTKRQVSATDRIGAAALEIDMTPGDGYEPFADSSNDSPASAAAGIEFSVSPAAVKPIGATRIKAPARHTEELEQELEMYRSAGGGSPAIKVLLAILLVAAAGGLGYLGYLILVEEDAPAIKAVIVEKDPGPQHAADVPSPVMNSVAVAPATAVAPDVASDAGSARVAGSASDSGTAAEVSGTPEAVPATDVPVSPDAGRRPDLAVAPVVVSATPAVKATPAGQSASASVDVRPAPSAEPAVVPKPRPAPAVEPVKPVPAPRAEPAPRAQLSEPRPKPEPVKEPPASKKTPSVGVSVAPDDYMGHVKAGNAALRGDPEQALVHYEVAESLKPGSTMILTKMGDASKALNRADTAREYYQRALRTNPSYNPAIVGLARIAREKGQIEEARKYYQRYLDVNASAPAAAEARQFLGSAP